MVQLMKEAHRDKKDIPFDYNGLEEIRTKIKNKTLAEEKKPKVESKRIFDLAAMRKVCKCKH